ncbi:biotin/lipoyl-binding protein [Ruminiclostridium herbifermentans]|uniref:Biotin/lipoyl-binding protein n=1 Tax=Ruminiclostridium herbifermentans TaxID=2488810 RepID=A0A4U7JMJ3_9FIRM|nr:biotin/lipoyl-containing protein [Ruminiclostridium herbifermentans]QNU65324.1 biotin/lipoyl-binding protein [Ruminiclostridium herbifermentans]
MSKYIIKVNGNPYEVEVQEVGGTASRASAPATKMPAKAAAPRTAKVAQTASGNAGEVIAPMPGTVLKLKVANGETVKKGQVILILEAMKMENEIVSTADGKVTLNVSEGQAVVAHEVMATVE